MSRRHSNAQNLYSDVETQLGIKHFYLKHCNKSYVFVLCAILVILLSACAICMTWSTHQQPRRDGPESEIYDVYGNKIACFEVSAHKYLQCPSGKENRHTLRINDASHGSEHEHVKGVVLTPTGLKIMYSGRYYVYKSIFFVPDFDETCQELDKEIFVSSIQKKDSTNGTNKLLSSAHTCCPTCRYNRESAFTGGIFEFVVGDVIQVHVNVDPEQYMYFNKDVSFVGLKMISG